MANKTERALPPIPVKRYFSLEELCYLADIQLEQFFQWQQDNGVVIGKSNKKEVLYRKTQAWEQYYKVAY